MGQASIECGLKNVTEVLKFEVVNLLKDGKLSEKPCAVGKVTFGKTFLGYSFTSDDCTAIICHCFGIHCFCGLDLHR